MDGQMDEIQRAATHREALLKEMQRENLELRSRADVLKKDVGAQTTTVYGNLEEEVKRLEKVVS